MLQLRELVRTFDIDYTSVSVSVKRFEERMRRDKNIKGIVDKAIEKIEKGEELMVNVKTQHWEAFYPLALKQ